MPRKKKMPKRKWAVIQAVDGIEYLVPFGQVDDPEPNCRTIPVLDAVAAEARLVQVRELAKKAVRLRAQLAEVTRELDSAKARIKILTAPCENVDHMSAHCCLATCERSQWCRPCKARAALATPAEPEMIARHGMPPTKEDGKT